MTGTSSRVRPKGLQNSSNEFKISSNVLLLALDSKQKLSFYFVAGTLLRNEKPNSFQYLTLGNAC